MSLGFSVGIGKKIYFSTVNGPIEAVEYTGCDDEGRFHFSWRGDGWSCGKKDMGLCFRTGRFDLWLTVERSQRGGERIKIHIEADKNIGVMRELQWLLDWRKISERIL